MKTITKYQADDGVEFTDPEECRIHEERCITATRIMADLPPRPEGCAFANGRGYIQHDGKDFVRVRELFLKFIQYNYSDHQWLQQSIDKWPNVDPSYAGRIIQECCPASIYNHWYRFSCTDRQLREWGQPYFRNHPEEAAPICINPEGATV